MIRAFLASLESGPIPDAVPGTGRRVVGPSTQLAVLTAGALLLGACSPSPGVSFFPLDGGHAWTYTLSSDWESGTHESETVVLSNEGRDGRLASGKAWRRRSDTGVDYWLRDDDTGVYRVATKSDIDEDPKADPAPRFVLKAPIAVGTTWQATTAPYLLRRRTEFPPEIRHSHPSVPMTYAIEALDAKVSTSAGAFEGCIRVKGSAVLKLFTDPVNGWQNMPLTTLEWYCKGVGLVRVERTEPANSTFLVGGTMVMDLQAWH